MGNRYFLNIKIIDVQTGAHLRALKIQEVSLDDLVDKLDAAAFGIAGVQYTDLREIETRKEESDRIEPHYPPIILDKSGRIYYDNYTYKGLSGLRQFISALELLPDMPDQLRQAIDRFKSKQRGSMILAFSGIGLALVSAIPFALAFTDVITESDYVPNEELVGALSGAGVVLGLVFEIWGLGAAYLPPKEVIHLYNRVYGQQD